MSTKEEFEKLNELLGSCLSSLRCGVNLDDLDFRLSLSIRKKCEELSSELVVLE